jgi:hypothetical protein
MNNNYQPIGTVRTPFDEHVKEGNFTPFSNSFLQDFSISNAAKGLLCGRLSYPENWKHRIEDIVTKNRVLQKENEDWNLDSRYAILQQFDELIEHGYCSKIYERNNHGSVITTYFRFYQVAQEHKQITYILNFEDDKVTFTKPKTKIKIKVKEDLDIEILSEKYNMSKESLQELINEVSAQDRTKQQTMTNDNNTPSVLKHDFKLLILNEDDFKNDLSTKYHITNDEIKTLLEIFDKSKSAQAHTELSKYKSHFDFWLNKFPIRKTLSKEKVTAQKIDLETIQKEYKRYVMMFEALEENTTYTLFNETLTTLLDYGKRCSDAGIFKTDKGKEFYQKFVSISKEKTKYFKALTTTKTNEPEINLENILKAV